MLHLSTETYNNEQVQRFLGRILSETCLKMDYFGSKFPKIAKRWGLLRRLGSSPPNPR